MSIIIKGMEMPTEGEYNMTLYVCSDGSAYMDVASFPVDKDRFEAVPIPPHGRLIDADKQDAQIEALIERHLHGYTKSTWDFVCELRDILKRNSTIIPAEEGE